MKLFNSKETVVGEQKADGDFHLPLGSFAQYKVRIFYIIVFVASTVCFGISWGTELKDNKALKEQQMSLQEDMLAANSEKAMVSEETSELVANTELIEEVSPVMLAEYENLYKQNEDFIGWLRIEDTVIDYPVMQCAEDENFYLSYDFYKEENKNGCLILDNDSNAGIGTMEQGYVNGTKPSTNLIIHGHTMKSGQMFGDLKLYQDEEYGLSHNIICFNSLYEKREYELIAVFYSQVYYKSSDVFKYYAFFQADKQEEFDDWYNNIKEMSLYDTGVTAEFGDEFITLSCCAYHVTDGRFVVVAKRVYS